jgi:hypothetical protein
MSEANGKLIVPENFQRREAATSDAVSFMQIIERAARDPAVDIDKMERLMQMHERMVDKKAEADFNDALTACQKECGTIGANATNPQTRSKYLTYAKLDSILRPIYTKHGISISYGTEDTPKAECVRIIAYVSRGGHTRVYRVDMPADGKGAKGGDVMTKTHATGAAMSYGCRYLLKAIFNISIGEEDDDGNLQRKEMPESTKADFLTAIEICETEDQASKLWVQILDATSKAGDIATHEELRSAMLKRRKAIKTAKAAV